MTVLAFAQAYAERGWPVLPLWSLRQSGGEHRCRCGRRDCKSPGKHPQHELVPHGLKDASCDLDTVTAWWERDPSANVGLLCGVAFDVLDIDHVDIDEGTDAITPCTTAGGPIVRTGAGKWHLYFAPTGIGRRIRFVEHCDYLGVGGYCVAPPSRHVAGGVYEWITPFSLELRRPPVELTMMLAPIPPTPRPAIGIRMQPRNGWSPTGLFGKMATAVEGQRNTTLHWCAARIGEDVAAGKVDENTALGALDQLADVARRAGLADREVAATIRSGYRP